MINGINVSTVDTDIYNNNTSIFDYHHPKAQFQFDYDQYEIFHKTELVCTLLSIIASIIVLIVYVYMLFYHSTNAHRVSLHCVILSIVVALINHVLDLVSLHVDVNTDYCHSFLIVDSILTLLSAALLSMVGIHLFLLFVMDAKWPCRPEYILIPVGCVYSFIGSLYCIFWTNNENRLIKPLFFKADNFCWYYSNFIERTYEKASWEFYYSFLFFVTTFAFILSSIAMWTIYRVKIRAHEQLKLIHRTQPLLNMFKRKSTNEHDDPPHQPSHQHQLSTNSENTSITINVSNDTHSYSNIFNKGSSSHHQDHDHAITDPLKNSKLHNTAFTKIVLRSLLYPCVPFIIHVWGFILQMQLIDPDFSANFAFCMVSLIMTCLEGVFLAFIFFSDPTVYTIPFEVYQKCIKTFGSN
ncbi:unnamed protein product [Cunninghamella blakesleeana]